MSLESRVERLEQAAGIGDDAGLCACPTMRWDIRPYLNESTSVEDARSDTRPAQVCERCRRPKRIIQLIGCYTRADVEASRSDSH